jgi:hypothetical protein
MRNFLNVVFAAATAALLVASSAAISAAAARGFDGIWSVSILTYRGDCDRSYRYPLRIWNGRVIKADNDPNYRVAGAVAASGAIRVTVAGGGQAATGSGRLQGNTGAGIWHTTNGRCSGRWTAVRRS